MTIIQAIILGLLQGLTEFLPVSSSGHIELGKALFHIQQTENLTFSIIVHAATVCSTIIILKNELLELLKGLFKFRWNFETKYIALLLVSMIPVGVIGVLFEEKIELLFEGRTFMVGCMLVITALFLLLTRYSLNTDKEITIFSAMIIGLAQALAIIPGISRSGATIAMALMLGIGKEKATRFSFLMVLLPIIGASLLKLKSLIEVQHDTSFEPGPLITGFIVAFITGLFACKWMLSIVKRGKIIYFSIYCFIIGLIAITISLL